MSQHNNTKHRKLHEKLRNGYHQTWDGIVVKNRPNTGYGPHLPKSVTRGTQPSDRKRPGCDWSKIP